MNPETPSITPLVTSEETLQKFSTEEQYLLRPRESVVLGEEVMVKFHKNQLPNQSHKNPWISWTLNKIAVVSKEWIDAQGPNPISNMSWWRVKIVKETSPGQDIGCFIVKPLWEVPRSDLVTLVPNTWEQVQKGLTIMLYPKIKPWMPWIIPKALRKMTMRKTGGSALIIPLSYAPDEQEEP